MSGEDLEGQRGKTGLSEARQQGLLLLSLLSSRCFRDTPDSCPLLPCPVLDVPVFYVHRILRQVFGQERRLWVQIPALPL